MYSSLCSLLELIKHNDYLGIIHENKKYQNRFKGKTTIKVSL